MAVTLTEDFLNHHGVKGQQWGVRRRANKLAKADKKWEQNINSMSTYIKVHNRAADLANTLDIDRINNLPKFKDRDMHDYNDPVTKAYFKAHEDAFDKRMAQAAVEIIGSNPSGTKKIHIDMKTGVTSLVDIDASHENKPGDIIITRDAKGYIVSFEVVEDSMMQTNLDIDIFLEHFGVKGQQWGVRKPRTLKEESARSKRQKLSDRRRHLSDADLKSHIDRISNEKKLKDLVDADLRPGQTIAKKIMSDSGQKVARTVIAGAALLAIKTAMTRKFSVVDAVGYIAPRPKIK